jgi:hypothetical protein
VQILTLDASPIVLVGRQELNFVQKILTAMKKARHKSLKIAIVESLTSSTRPYQRNLLQQVTELLNDSYHYTRKFS